MTVKNLPTATLKKSTRQVQVRKSGVHGRGVFAVQDIPKGAFVVEYLGEIISAQEAEDRHPHNPADPNHTFYFQIDEDRVIDGLRGGNASRWINHSCMPNCEPEVKDGRVYISALSNIAAGEELNYDYGLVIDERITKKLKAQYPCWCGSSNCRATLLAVKDKGTPKDKKAELKDLKRKLKKIKLKISALTQKKNK